MLVWILLGIIIYLLVGVAILVVAVKKEPTYGFLILEMWWFVIIAFPFLIAYSTIQKFRK